MAVVNDIVDSMKTKIEAITPSQYNYPLFRESKSKEPLAEAIKGGKFERSFRITPLGDSVLMKPWGSTSGEYQETFDVTFGYVSEQDDLKVHRKMDSDRQDIIKALQSAGLSWPSSLVNILVLGQGSKISVGEEGANAYLMSIPFQLTYDIT